MVQQFACLIAWKGQGRYLQVPNSANWAGRGIGLDVGIGIGTKFEISAGIGLWQSRGWAESGCGRMSHPTSSISANAVLVFAGEGSEKNEEGREF